MLVNEINKSHYQKSMSLGSTRTQMRSRPGRNPTVCCLKGEEDDEEDNASKIATPRRAPSINCRLDNCNGSQTIEVKRWS